MSPAPAAPAAEVMIPPPTRTYTLAEVFEEARRSAYPLRPWEFTRQRAAGRVASARTELAPSVRARGRVVVLSTQDALGSSEEPGGFGRDRIRVNLSASYPVYDAGRRAAQLRAAEAELRGTEETIRGGEAELMQDLAAAFYRVLRRQRLVESSRLEIAAAGELLRGARARFDLGTVARGDVFAAQSALSSAEAEAARRGADLVGARAQLANLMGLDPTKAVPAAAADPAADIPALNGTLEQLVARALEHSPERARLAAERDAARARLAAARAERAPTVTARANIGHVFGDTGGGGSRGDLPYSRLTLGVDLPLFEGGAIRAREQTLAAEVGLQEAALARAENGIKTDVVSAYTLFRAGAPTIQAAGDAVRAAEEARRLAQERYAVGRGTQLEVLRSLEDFAAARVRQAGAQNDQELAAHNLAFLTGVGAAAMPAREPDTPPDAGGTPDVRPPLSGNNSGTGERPADR